jgi:hypothetical protein
MDLNASLCPMGTTCFSYNTFNHMCQWKGFQLLIIVDLPNVNCPLVLFLAIHHNNCVIDELCWFLQPQ